MAGGSVKSSASAKGPPARTSEARRSDGTLGGGGPCAAAVGLWNWSGDPERRLWIEADGSFTLPSQSRHGRWSCYGRAIRMVWSHGFTDQLELSDEGRSLRGFGWADADPLRKQRSWRERVAGAPVAVTQTAAKPVETGPTPDRGFYVVELSGEGWRKRKRERAHRIHGSQRLIVEVSNDVATAREGRDHWTVPSVDDLDALFERWREDARRAGAQACEARPPRCPCNIQPDIWSQGPDYRVVQGPFATTAAALAVSGDSQALN